MYQGVRTLIKFFALRFDRAQTGGVASKVDLKKAALLV